MGLKNNAVVERSDGGGIKEGGEVRRGDEERR
jgi:hypothetical protein